MSVARCCGWIRGPRQFESHGREESAGIARCGIEPGFNPSKIRSILAQTGQCSRCRLLEMHIPGIDVDGLGSRGGLLHTELVGPERAVVPASPRLARSARWAAVWCNARQGAVLAPIS